jgi:hypothetical protein
VNYSQRFLLAVCGCVAVGLVGCVPQVPPDAFTLQPEALSLRRLQTRKFDTSDEKEILRASLGVLQDLGFEIDEAQSKLGVLVGSKDRDATDAMQITANIAIAVFAGGEASPVDRNQKIRVSLVTHVLSPRESQVRVTFQRTVWDTQGNISRAESLTDPELYQEFFSKLSKALFLEAHGI